jgi:hypothetical protein
MNAHSEQPRGAIGRWLGRSPAAVLVTYAVAASFATYFCMYAFRKPFTAAKFEGASFFGTHVELKTALLISQIIGYAISKYVGIKVCSEVTPERRAWLLVGLVLWAEAALLLFAVVPSEWKFAAIFLNGLPLGMVWGLVVWYLEGRRTSELLLAGLSCSFILSSGIVKDVGRSVMNDWGVSEAWMPAVVGLCFLGPFLLAVWLLDQIPKPSRADELARSERTPMDAARRRAFLRKFLGGIVLLLVAYLLLTAYRDFRDNYQVEIFEELGYSYEQNRAIITRAESLVAFAVLAAMALLFLVRDNRWGLLGVFALMTGGLVLLGLSTPLHAAGLISGFWWMTLVGIGSYLAYVPFGSVLFDRLIASTRSVGTAVYAIYLADAVGYTGSVGLQLYKDLGRHEEPRLVFFQGLTWLLAIAGSLFLTSSCAYFMFFHRHYSAADSTPGPPPQSLETV